MKKIILSGSSGFIGKELKKRLEENGFFVFTVSKDQLIDDFLIDLNSFENAEAWIHLGGESISAFRWTKRKKQKILESRLHSNLIIKNLIKKLNNPPSQIFIASGIGYYGFDKIAEIDETGDKGLGFLSDVACQLENIWTDSDIKPIFMRFATVLSFAGGALEKISLPWKMKVCPFYGSPDNFFPIITRDELIKMILFLIGKNKINGPINFCSLISYSQKFIFSKISKKYKPIIFFTIPRFFIKCLIGQIGVETLLINMKIFPRKLYELGYDFSDEKMFAKLEKE